MYKKYTKNTNDLIREFKSSLVETEKRLAERLDLHDNELKSLRDRVAKLENVNPGTISVTDKEDLLSEIENRHTRASNIIVFNLPKAVKGKTDLESLNKVFGEIKDFPCAISAGRITPKPRDNRPLPLKVSFASKSDALMVLRNKDKLIKYKLTVKNDITPQQQNYLKSLQSELDLRIENGEKNLTIKYKKGIPKIVQIENPKN